MAADTLSFSAATAAAPIPCCDDTIYHNNDKLLATPAQSQIRSPLFGQLPAEIRSDIFAYALTDYPDPCPDKAYGRATCYTRPAYFAPSKTDVALLQTCRAVYQECWHLPFLLREQVHWAVYDKDRAPPGYEFGPEMSRLESTLRAMRKYQRQKFEIRNLRVFSQMSMLESGNFARLLQTPELHPRTLTLTIRHADWWHWEEDDPLKFEGRWIPKVNEALSESVREIRIEVESLERKKAQVDGIAGQMMQKWFFKRADGVVLYADCKEVTRWKGTSRWHNMRWTRDESAEGVIDYYFTTVVFRPEHVLRKKSRAISALAKEYAQSAEAPSNVQLKLHDPSWKGMGYTQPRIKENDPRNFIMRRRSTRYRT